MARQVDTKTDIVCGLDAVIQPRAYVPLCSRDPQVGKRLKRALLIAGCSCAVIALVLATIVYRAWYPPAPEVDDTRIKVAAVGDSNTFGAGVIFDHRDRNSYPAQLQVLLGSRYQVLNYGLSGRTLLDSGDWPYRDNEFAGITKAIDPDIVLIMLGSNDAKPHNWNAPEYERQLAALVSSYTNLSSHPDVYLMTPPAAYANAMGINGQVVRNEIVPIVLRVASRTGTPVVDVFSATNGREQDFPDGVHPNAAGYRIIADAVYAALQVRE